MKLSFVAVLSALALSSVVGCAAQAGDDVDTSGADLSAATVSPGTFSLYAEPDANANQRCNVFTELTLNDSKAHLQEVAQGVCQIYVIPNDRSYRLTLLGEECGSKIFKGTTTTHARRHDITVTDHRSRTCKDIVAAPIIVEETDDNGQLETTYAVSAR